jgi:hypothetical protein
VKSADADAQAKNRLMTRPDNVYRSTAPAVFRVFAGVLAAGCYVRAGERGCGQPVTVITSSAVRAGQVLWNALTTRCDRET